MKRGTTFERPVKQINIMYKRCNECEVPMHRDGHETPAWCANPDCPCTEIRSEDEHNHTK